MKFALPICKHATCCIRQTLCALLLWGAISPVVATGIFQSFSLGLLLEGHLTNIMYDEMIPHVTVLRNIPMLDTLPDGSYSYDPSGVLASIRGGLVANAFVNNALSLEAQVTYSRKGETIRFISTATGEVSVFLNFLDCAVLARYYPSIVSPLGLSVNVGGFIGFPLSTQEIISVYGVVNGQPVRIHQEYDLDQWLPGVDAGVILGMGTMLGTGIRRMGFDINVSLGTSDLRGSTSKNNQLFPHTIRTVSFAGTITSYLGLWKR